MVAMKAMKALKAMKKAKATKKAKHVVKEMTPKAVYLYFSEIILNSLRESERFPERFQKARELVK